MQKTYFRSNCEDQELPVETIAMPQDISMCSRYRIRLEEGLGLCEEWKNL